MERFDVVVVGAGPAGSTAAFRLARAGASVLLVDRARFPRDKPCGGGLTGRALRHLPIDVEPVVEERVDRVELGLRYGRRFERRSREPLILMTQRRRLDALLAEHAAAAGADFRDGVRVGGIEAGEGSVEVRVDGAPVAAEVLIGADGANGTVGRATGLGTDIEHGVALEGNVFYEELDGGDYRGRALLELCVVAGGYGWLFPKGDHVNIGVGGWGYEGPRLRDYLRRYCAFHRVPDSAVRDLRGHRLPMRRAATALARARVCLVGDAAGLVDPISGDGLFEAFLSSQLAAEAALDVLAGRAGGLEPYADGLRSKLGSMMAASWGAKVALDRFPRITFAVTSLPPVWRVVESLVRGDLQTPSTVRGIARPPLKLLDALARHVGDPGRSFRAQTG